jgi:hypothetical protein
MKPPSSGNASTASATDAATAAAIATWPGGRRGILHLLECRLLHRGAWEYLGSRYDETAGSWPIDAYRCGWCERAWEQAG